MQLDKKRTKGGSVWRSLGAVALLMLPALNVNRATAKAGLDILEACL